MNQNEIIPLSVPNIKGNEWKYVKECLDTGWISTAGKFVEDFENKIKEVLNIEYAVSTMNGTSALHIALMINNVHPGEYVIIPNITFVATANAIAYNQAIPILVDVNEDNWQLDLDLLEEFLSNETIMNSDGLCVYKKEKNIIRAILIVHNQGNMCDMGRLLLISKKYGITIIEDAAESLGSTFNKQHAGTFGSMGCLSFNGNKIISTGGGGMIVTNNELLFQKAKHLITTAKTDPLDYFHDEVGYNYRLVNVLAAIGIAQMENINEFVESKIRIAKYYISKLNDVNDISFQKINDNVNFNYWLFTIRTKHRLKLQEYLNNNGIQCRPIWTPMKLLPMFKDLKYITKENISLKLKEECLNLPCSTNITEFQLERVIDNIIRFYNNIHD